MAGPYGHKYIPIPDTSLANAAANIPKGLLVTLILDRYRLIGRAGSGGYATVQHAYDTRLKRDVAIKCIEIPKQDSPRTRMTIHDAQMENATRPLAKGAATAAAKRAGAKGAKGADGKDAKRGFVPLSAKIDEPGFLRKRDKRIMERARRRAVNGGPRPGVDAQRLDEDWDSGRTDDGVSDENLLYKDGVLNLDVSKLEETQDFYALGSRADRRDDMGGTAVIFRRSSHDEDEDDDSIEMEEDEDVLAPAGPTEDPLAAMGSIPGLEEAQTAAHLNDVNIVTVYDFVVEDDTAYVIMEYVEGKTLARIMKEVGNGITLDMVANVFSSISHALEVAHGANVLHLDVKPENVIVNGEGVVKVTDFGLSTLMDSTGHGQTGGGTIGYMPLEQMRQQRLDVRTDEWALASLTYEMLSGRNPFKARNLKEAEEAIEDAQLILPSLCWDGIDTNVDDIMFEALSPEMDGRFSSIEEFADELTPLLGDSHAGKAQLAKAVESDGPSTSSEEESEPKQSGPKVPFIDKLGIRGSDIVMRAFAVLGSAIITAMALIGATMGLPEAVDGVAAGSGMFTTMPIAAWAILAVMAVLSAVFPRYGVPGSYMLFGAMLLTDGSIALGIAILLLTGVWWWFCGRRNDMMCSIVGLQPLFGSLGMSCIAAVAAGALLDVKDAMKAMAMIALSAIVFASMGSGDVSDWGLVSSNAFAGFQLLSAQTIAVGFMSTVSYIGNWCTIAGWFAGAAAFSAICRKGTRTYDLLGGVACAAIIVAGTILFPLLTGAAWALSPLVIGGLAIGSLLAIAFAALEVTDRVRMAPGEW